VCVFVVCAVWGEMCAFPMVVGLCYVLVLLSH